MKTQKAEKYRLFYTGVASTPNSVGIISETTNEKLCEIDVAMPTGKETREKYDKIIGFLQKKFEKILSN